MWKLKKFTLIDTPRCENANWGFTLIELLITISIIGILVGMVTLGLGNARSASRDTQRKADLATIASAAELYKADCGTYPLTTEIDDNYGSPLVGNGGSCPSGNVYLSDIPQDPHASLGNSYSYFSDGVTFEICTALEDTSQPIVVCGASSDCGSSQCLYKVINP